MPVVTVHPNKKWMLCQSLDNQILCYGSTGLPLFLKCFPALFYLILDSDRFKLHKKKLFRGHNNAGFACGITTPPDGALCHTRLPLRNFYLLDQVHTLSAATQTGECLFGTGRAVKYTKSFRRMRRCVHPLLFSCRLLIASFLYF
jgi:hypothetical protein